MQQDAEEFYAAVSQCLSRGASSIGRDYSSILGIELEERLTCQETDLEPSITKIEAANKVVCNIQGASPLTL